VRFPGVPLAREYGGLLDNRSLEVRLFLELLCKRANRTTIAFRAYSAMNRQIGRGKIKMHHRHEMLDLVIVDGRLEVLSHVTWLLVKSKDILLMQ
jgi:succinate dehydrogenase / fumarate reductase flavoprotein subunit